MMKKAIIIIFLISAMFINGPQLFADSAMYNSDNFGNIMGYVSDTGATAGSIYDLSMTSPQDDWYNKNIAAHGYGTPRVVVCNDTTKQCNYVEGDVQKPTKFIPPTKRPTAPVNYFTQDCIDKGFVTVTNYPYTYKCSEDKTAYYVCYKNQKLGYYIEPNPYPFTKPLETNKFRKAICDLTPAIVVQEQPTTETPPQVNQPTTEDSETITDASLFPSLIQKIGFIGFDNLKINFTNSNVPKTNLRVPYFIINYGTDDIYRANDINVTVHLDENGFNFNEEIYALVVTSEKKNDIIATINDFVKTQNSEYQNHQEYKISNMQYNVECNCKYQKTENEPIQHYPMFGVFAELNVVNGALDNSAKDAVNDLCSNQCTINQKEVRNNAPGLYKYDLGDYIVTWPEPTTIIKNYKLTTTQNIDKIKFTPNGNIFQFTINKNNPNKKFVIVFLQKSETKLNISYSNLYVLNNDEILSYSLCEANRVILSNFCDSSINSECSEVKSCYNGFDLNYDSIDVTEFIYSLNDGGNMAIPINDTPPADTPPANTPPADTQNYYSTKNNTGDACSNANLTTNQWGCVCIIQSSGTKRVVPAKCSATYGLVLYGAPDRGRVPATYQFCYNEAPTSCR